MSHNLKSTKIKLSIVFTIIVFLIASILELSYFTFKYQNIKHIEIRDFEIQTNEFLYRFDSVNNFLDNYNLSPGFRRGMMGNRQLPQTIAYLNFVIIDNKKEILFGNITQDINYSLDYKIDKDTIKVINSTYVLKKTLSNQNHIIFFSKQKYPFISYINDLSLFFLFNFIFAILFFSVGYLFVNKNLKPVEQSLSDMKDFIQNASHELKTPLSVVSSNMQLLKNMGQYDKDLVQNSIYEIKKIDGLILGLIDLSSISKDTILNEINISETIQEILIQFKKELDEKDINLKFDIQKNTILKANKYYFYILISNLIQNAIKYNYLGGEIIIIIGDRYISIGSTGEKIEKQDLKKVFNRFYKGDKSRNTKGFGIGLSLVRKICDIYGWDIEVRVWDNKNIFDLKF